MSDSVIAQAILEEVRRLATRFERMEGRMSALEARMSALEGRVSGVEGRMSTFESRMSGLDARMTNIEDVVAALNLEKRTWPDMHFVGAAAKSQTSHSREIRAEVSDIRVRVEERYQAMATDPEIKSLRQEVSRFRDQSLTTDVLLGAIEGRLGIKSEVEAPVS